MSRRFQPFRGREWVPAFVSVSRSSRESAISASWCTPQLTMHVSEECMAALAEAGFDTMATDSAGRTGLMRAAYGGSGAAGRAVLGLGGAGAALEAKDNNGATA